MKRERERERDREIEGERENREMGKSTLLVVYLCVYRLALLVN